jgi:hypothetical protein
VKYPHAMYPAPSLSWVQRASCALNTSQHGDCKGAKSSEWPRNPACTSTSGCHAIQLKRGVAGRVPPQCRNPSVPWVQLCTEQAPTQMPGEEHCPQHPQVITWENQPSWSVHQQQQEQLLCLPSKAAGGQEAEGPGPTIRPAIKASQLKSPE